MTEPETPRIFIAMATTNIGGPGKGLLQFFRCGGKELCRPYVCSYLVRAEVKVWPFRGAVQALSIPFLTVRQRFAIDPFIVVQAYQLIRKYELQVLQSHEYKSHVLCLILKKLTGRPWVGFFHGWTTENWKVRLYHSIDKIALRFADRVVVVADAMREKLVASGADESRIVTINNAIEQKEAALPEAGAAIRSRFGVGEREKLLGVVGRFSPEKGQIYFLEALKLVLDKFPMVKGMLVGDGQDENVLRSSVMELGMEDKVIFAGYQTEVASFYQSFDIVVLPSLSEGMPNVALEAMMHGKPVVATKVGGVPEVVKDQVTGLLVDPADSGLLADAICDMLHDPSLSLEYGSSARLFVEKEFNPYNRVEKIINIYSELADVP